MPYKIILPLIFAVITTGAALAESATKAGRHDARIRTAVYQEGQVYRIYTRLKHSTLIEVGKGERVLSVSLGDSTGFLPEEIDTNNAFYIKPLVRGAVTNATVETNRRFYFLQLYETSKTAPNYRVQFVVPDPRRAKSASTIPASTPMRYAISSKTPKASFKPRRIWDDGRKTHFQFAPDAPIPAVFRADTSGREYTVNTTDARNNNNRHDTLNTLGVASW